MSRQGSFNSYSTYFIRSNSFAAKLTSKLSLGLVWASAHQLCRLYWHEHLCLWLRKGRVWRLSCSSLQLQVAFNPRRIFKSSLFHVKNKASVFSGVSVLNEAGGVSCDLVKWEKWAFTRLYLFQPLSELKYCYFLGVTLCKTHRPMRPWCSYWSAGKSIGCSAVSMWIGENWVSWAVAPWYAFVVDC